MRRGARGVLSAVALVVTAAGCSDSETTTYPWPEPVLPASYTADPAPVAALLQSASAAFADDYRLVETHTYAVADDHDRDLVRAQLEEILPGWTPAATGADGETATWMRGEQRVSLVYTAIGGEEIAVVFTTERADD